MRWPMFAFFNLGMQELVILGILALGVLGVIVVVVVLASGNKRDED